MPAEHSELNASRVFDLLKKIIAKNFRLREEDISPTSSLEDLDLDSIDAVDIVVSIEEETGFHFQPEHLEGVHVLQDVVDVVVSGLHLRSE